MTESGHKPGNARQCMRAASLLAIAVAFSLALSLGGLAKGATGKVAGSGAMVGPSSAKGTMQGEPIVIGMPLGLSGFLEFFDGNFLLGARLAVTDVNARGGILGRPLRIVTADTKSNIASGTNAALDVISKGANFVLPTTDYDFGSPGARAAQSKNLIAMSLVGDPRYGRQGIGPLVFNIYQATPTEGAASAQFAFGVKKWRRPYLLIDTSTNYPKSLCSYFEQSWQRLAGKTIAGRDTFQNSDPSIRTQITRLMSADQQPDFIFLCSYQPGGISAVRQIRAAGIELPILHSVSFDTNAWLSAVPNETNSYSASAGVVGGKDPSRARRAVFQKYKKLTGKEVPYPLGVLSGYSAIEALALASRRAGSIDTNAVKVQLEKFRNVPLAIGPTTWTRRCHIPLGRPLVYVRPTLKKVFYVATVKPKALPKSPC